MYSQLKRTGSDKATPYLTIAGAWALAFGCSVGWGAFVMPGNTFLPLAGPVGSAVGLGLSAFVILIIAVNYHYLMIRFPDAGGTYTYTKKSFGYDHGFLSAWFLCLSYLTVVFLNGTALFVVVRTMMNGATVSGLHYTIAGNDIYLSEVLVSVAAFALVGLLFVKAKPFLQKLFRALAVALVAGVILTVAVCVPHAISSGAFRDFGTLGLGRGYGVFTLVILAPWAFVGFESICFDTAHFKFAAKRAKWVIFAAILVAGFIYATMPVVAVSFVPDGYASWGAYVADLDKLSGVASVPTFNAARAYMGNFGLAVMAVSALAANDKERVLDIINASGNSSWMWLQNAYVATDAEEQPIPFALALTKIFLKNTLYGACRLHGGGFAGVIMCAVPKADSKDYVELMGKFFGPKNVYRTNIRAIGAVRLDTMKV